MLHRRPLPISGSCARHNTLLATMIATCALVLGATAPRAEAQGTVGSPANWSSELQIYATKTLSDNNALSLTAIPLNGPGIEQYINADVPMSPGSIMKLITTYAALEILGPSFRWDTRFYTDGELSGSTLNGNLYVRFGGDPKLSLERLWSTIHELRDMGIDTVNGDLVLDGSYFHLPDGLPTFDDNGDNPYAPFLVKPSAYLSNYNLLHFEVRADERGTQAWTTPVIDGIQIDNRVVATAEAPCPSHHRFQWQPVFHDDGPISVRVTGELPRGCRTSEYLSLLPQSRYSAELIRSLWRGMGGTITGGNRLAETPEDARLVMQTTSPDLVTMVRDINKWSNNVMARQLLLTIGAENRKPDDGDDRVAGIHRIYDWLASKGINTRGMVIDNGAGLSRYGRMTSRQTAKILQHAWNSRYAADLMSSLPLIATDGTMVRRLRDTDLEGEGRIKTGSLQGVRAIAGFTRDKAQTTWAIVGMVNHTPAWNGQAVLDRALYSLYYHPPVGTALSQAASGGSAIQ